MKSIPGYILLCMTCSGSLVAQQGYYPNTGNPGQINWPQPVTGTYPAPELPAYPDSAAAPAYTPPSGRYAYDRYYGSRGYQPRSGYWENPYVQPEYVAPPGPDWPDAAYDSRSLLPPDMLLQDGFIPPHPENRELVPGTPVEVVPPPNIPLSRHPAVSPDRGNMGRMPGSASGGIRSGYPLSPGAFGVQNRQEPTGSGTSNEADKTVEVVPPPSISFSSDDVISTTKPVSGWRPDEGEQPGSETGAAKMMSGARMSSQ